MYIGISPIRQTQGMNYVFLTSSCLSVLNILNLVGNFPKIWHERNKISFLKSYSNLFIKHLSTSPCTLYKAHVGYKSFILYEEKHETKTSVSVKLTKTRTVTLSDRREEITFWVRRRIRMLFKVTWDSSFVRHALVSKILTTFACSVPDVLTAGKVSRRDFSKLLVRFSESEHSFTRESSSPTLPRPISKCSTKFCESHRWLINRLCFHVAAFRPSLLRRGPHRVPQ